MDKTKTGARHRTAGGRGREDKDNKNNAKRTSSGTSSAGESARTRSSPSKIAWSPSVAALGGRLHVVGGSETIQGQGAFVQRTHYVLEPGAGGARAAARWRDRFCVFSTNVVLRMSWRRPKQI